MLKSIDMSMLRVSIVSLKVAHFVFSFVNADLRVFLSVFHVLPLRLTPLRSFSDLSLASWVFEQESNTLHDCMLIDLLLFCPRSQRFCIFAT